MDATEPIEIKVPVADLQLGMSVVRLDRPWIETSFPVQGFVIRHEADIEALREQCQYVYVEGQELPAKTAGLSRLSGGLAGRKRKRAVPRLASISVEEEMVSAQQAYRHARSMAKDIISSVRMGQVLDVRRARSVVRECVDSVLRNQEALQMLAQIRGRDAYTAEHSMNVCVLSALFGKHLGMLSGEMEKLALAGLLHDLGNVRVPEQLLTKPESLTPEEFEQVKVHTEHGRRLLMSTSGLDPVTVDVAYSHHERMDGNGYPRGLLAHQVPYFAKIVSIVDAYDAMITDRFHAEALSSREALDVIYQQRGQQFDESLALDFIQCIGVFPAGSLVELSTGESAIVITTYALNRLRPRVLVVRDASGEPCRERVVDLRRRDEQSAGVPYQIRRELPTGSQGIELGDYLEQGLTLHNEDPDPELRVLVDALNGHDPDEQSS